MKRERICSKPLGDYIPALDVVELAGVTPSTLYAWLKRRGYRRCPHSRVLRGVLYVHLDVVDEYLEGDGIPRRRPPEGWVTKSEAVKLSGRSTFWWDRHIRRGEARAVRYKRLVWIHPDDVEHAKAEHEASEPPPGWVLLSSLAKRYGVTDATMRRRTQRAGIRWRLYAHPVTRQLAAYIHESDVDRVVYGHAVRLVPPDGWVPYTRLAAEMGIDPQVVWGWMRRHGYRVVMAREPGRPRTGWCAPEAWEAYQRASYKLAGRGRAS